MIKISTNRYGTIHIEEDSLKKSIKKCLLDTVAEKKLINIDLNVRKIF